MHILPSTVLAFLFRLGLNLLPLSITVLLLLSATDGPAWVRSDWDSGGLSMSVSFVIGVWLEVDTADVLSEVETIRLGTGNSGKKRLEDEAKAIGLDGMACCDDDGWLCYEENCNDWMILTGGELGIEISISDLN